MKERKGERGGGYSCVFEHMERRQTDRETDKTPDSNSIQLDSTSNQLDLIRYNTEQRAQCVHTLSALGRIAYRSNRDEDVSEHTIQRYSTIREAVTAIAACGWVLSG